nr:hypothetical protein Iba_chr10bCG2290 [Ipomoea batatas]GMD44641.1 hypothetical protein Iba_chr10dCG2440 [Ipomoea batatas]GMD46385.1 hypothetical protein Iba_chr10eCG2760 [Ipomoea batatas]GMD47918.1 hypothetical protein Iba_chr10fCG1410 [Ipomoea batatas]
MTAPSSISPCSSKASHKVSEEVSQAKPRTKSFRRAGSALATFLISSAIEGYCDPLLARRSTSCGLGSGSSRERNSSAAGGDMLEST